MRASSLTADAIVRAASGQISSNLAGEEVILQLETGVYYGLNPVGARVWALLQQPHSVAEICEVLLDEYDVEPARCRQDVQELLAQLAEAQLIEVIHARVEETQAAQSS